MPRKSRPINADVPPVDQDSTAASPPQGGGSGSAAVSDRPAAPAGRSAPPPDAPRTETISSPAAPSREPAPSQPAPTRPAPTRAPPPTAPRRRGIPSALKAIAALVVVAVIFIVAAVLGGGGGGGVPGAAPTATKSMQSSPSSGEEANRPSAGAPEELGYPEFATNNTTRIGGGDPASNAAAVSLAVYPSAAESQRPSAVTFVEATDWRSAIAAAALMAPPIGAPPLISEAGQLPDVTAAAFEALAPQGDRQTGGARAFAVGAAAVPAGVRARTVAGEGAAAAAALARLRQRLTGQRPHHIVVAPEEPSFAMPAAAWAARSGDPVLFAGKNRLPAPTAANIEGNRRASVYVLGPSSEISSDVVRQIAKIDGRVRRVAGEDPVSNAIALARYESGEFGWNVNDPGHGFVVTRSDSPLNAVAAAPLSASGTWGPLLLTDDADTLPNALREYFLDVKPGYTTDPTRAFYNHVWLVGDTEAISVAEQAEIDELAELAKIGGEG